MIPAYSNAHTRPVSGTSSRFPCAYVRHRMFSMLSLDSYRQPENRRAVPLVIYAPTTTVFLLCLLYPQTVQPTFDFLVHAPPTSQQTKVIGGGPPSVIAWRLFCWALHRFHRCLHGSGAASLMLSLQSDLSVGSQTSLSSARSVHLRPIQWSYRSRSCSPTKDEFAC